MIKSATLIRAFLWASAGVALSGAYAKADNFDFSFTGSLGTVTGEIYGLTNTGVVQAATTVQILTIPSTLGPYDANRDAASWQDVPFNEFIESGGAITAFHFVADDVGCPFCQYGFALENGEAILSETGAADVGAVTFTPAPSAVPEPAALVLLSTVLLAVALVARKTDSARQVNPATQEN